MSPDGTRSTLPARSRQCAPVAGGRPSPAHPVRRATRPLFLLAVVIILLVLPTTGNAEPVRRALLVGIDDYLAPTVSDLAGCGNDVELMRRVLIEKFELEPENILVLKDAAATRQAILDAIENHLVAPSQPGDVAILHYSGHGSQMRDAVDGDELDGFDETIVPHDARTGEVRDISDDELNDLMSRVSAKTEHATFVLDSCHSGSAVRAVPAGGTVRQIPPDLRPPPADAARGLVEGPDDFRLPGAGYVLISGSRANELSNETIFGGERHGALTYFLANALTSAGENVTYREVMEQVAADVTRRFPSQHPQVEGTGMDKIFFGVDSVVPRPFVLVEPDPASPGQAALLAGSIYGVARDTEIDVYPPRTRDFDDPSRVTARLRITGVDPFTSRAEVIEGTVEPHSRARLDVIRPPDFQVGVFLDGVDDSPLLQAVQQQLGDHESVEVVGQSGDAEIRVRETDDGLRLEGRSLELLSELGGDATAEAVVERIAHWGRWFSILAIDNPSPDLEIDLQVRRTDALPGEPSPEEVTAGTAVTLEVTNLSDRDVHVVVLDLASDGSIGILYPPANISDPIPPGETVRRDLGSSALEGRSVDVDIVKAIATTERIPTSVFRLGPVARSAAPPPPAESALQGFLRRSVQGLTRKLDPVQVDGWAVRQRALRVVTPRVATDGFVAHFGEATEASHAAEGLGSTRSVCGAAGAAGCFEVATVPGDETMVKITPPEVRSGERDLVSVGQSFADAYEIREETGALRVEPLLDYELPRAQTAPHPDTRGLGSDAPDPRAEADALWSLKTTRVPEAWATVRAATGRPEGEEATNVVVAHPDTGYLPHPEIFDGPDHLPAWPEKGYDYYGDDPDPTDDLIDRRLLDNPAHGTGSSSAIVSPTGCQLGGATKCPTGAARGARFVPLRLNRSVVQVSTDRMTQAILDASGSDRSRVKVPTDVMAIAMGGAPSWSLWKAVRKAEERGYLIIAAAGNYVRTVVWPARYDSVVAVAAVNVGCRPWKHSSRGSAVDFSATGESVWRATIDDDGEFVTGMGTGTTYATASTAGIASLWVARHKGTPAFEELRRRGAVTSTFRDLVQATSWRPNSARQPAAAQCDSGVGWDGSRFGTGIIDAAALLEAPLPGAPRGLDDHPVRAVTDLPLWYSLYPGGTPLAEAEADYRGLFTVGPDDALETVAIYEAEVLYHYAHDEGVAFAIDQIVIDEGSGSVDRAVEELRDQDLSPQLRRALRGAVP